MELKYKENPQWKIAGSLWMLNALMNLGFLIFMISGKGRVLGLMISLLYVIIILLSCVLAVFLFRITRIDYIRINDNTLSIHKGFVFPRKMINLSEVEEGRVLGNRLTLILKNGKKVNINLKYLTTKDFEKMKVKLEECFKIS